MKRTRRVEIRVETSRLVVRSGLGDATAWCVECSARARTVTTSEADALTGVIAGAVHRGAGAGRLHVIETAGSPPLICLNSLLASIGDGEGDDDAAARHDPG